MHRLVLILLLTLAACGPDEVPHHEHPHEHPAPELTAEDMAGYWVGHLVIRETDRLTRETVVTEWPIAVPIALGKSAIDFDTNLVCMAGPSPRLLVPIAGHEAIWDGQRWCGNRTGPATCANGESLIDYISSVHATITDDGVLTVVVEHTVAACSTPRDIVWTFTGRK